MGARKFIHGGMSPRTAVTEKVEGVPVDLRGRRGWLGGAVRTAARLRLVTSWRVGIPARRGRRGLSAVMFHVGGEKASV